MKVKAVQFLQKLVNTELISSYALQLVVPHYLSRRHVRDETR